MTSLFHIPIMFQLQGAGSADAGGHHGHAHLQRPRLRQREGRGGHQVHLHAPGNYDRRVSDSITRHTSRI